jgi:hypothetical protein
MENMLYLLYQGLLYTWNKTLINQSLYKERGKKNEGIIKKDKYYSTRIFTVI